MHGQAKGPPFPPPPLPPSIHHPSFANPTAGSLRLANKETNSGACPASSARTRRGAQPTFDEGEGRMPGPQVLPGVHGGWTRPPRAPGGTG